MFSVDCGGRGVGVVRLRRGNLSVRFHVQRGNIMRLTSFSSRRMGGTIVRPGRSVYCPTIRVREDNAKDLGVRTCGGGVGRSSISFICRGRRLGTRTNKGRLRVMVVSPRGLGTMCRVHLFSKIPTMRA